MSKFIRLINQGIQDLFISDGENFGDYSHQFKNGLPYSLADGQFMAVLPSLSEEFSDSFVIHEAFYDRKYVVPKRNKRSACNLSSKVVRLTFAHSKQSLALLEDDLYGPASGVNPVCLEESR